MSKSLLARLKGTKHKPTLFHKYFHIWNLMNSAFRLVQENYVSKIKNPYIVDFGCSDMPYKNYFSFDTYVGLDIEGNDIADGYVDFESNSSLSDNVCNVILSTQVLEHVSDPSNYLSESFRMLDDSGFLVLSTHGHWIYHGVPTDFWRWTSDGLKKLITDHGFDIVEFKGLMGVSAVGVQYLQDKFLQKFPLFMRIPILTPMFQMIIILIDFFVQQESRNKDAAVYLVVARKRQGS